MKRRSFLSALVLASGALALGFPSPQKYVLYGDGEHDDTEALQQWFNGNTENVVDVTGKPVGKKLHNGAFRFSKSLAFGPNVTGQEFCYNMLHFEPGASFIEESGYFGISPI